MAVRMSIQYLGKLETELTHDSSKVRFKTDAPVDNMGKGSSFSPTDMLGAALLSCMVTTMAIKGRKLGVELSQMSGTVEKNMTTTGARKIASLDIELFMPKDLPVEHRAVFEEFANTCPVALSLNPSVEIKTSFKY